MKKLFTFLLAFSVMIICKNGFSQTITLSSFATGFGKISDIKSAGDSRMFVVEQTGKIKITDSVGTVNATPFLTLTGLTSGNEQGLLGLAFHPNYSSNGYFFVDYTDASGRTHISRFTVSANPNIANAASEVNLLTIYQPYTNHNGGNLQFGPDGYLYINMGDGGNGGDPGNRAQNKDSLLGKILRIDVNNPVSPYYFSPSDNPYYGAIPGRDEIFTYGMRNPWRSSFDRITGDLWIADVGQGLWEEIDFRKNGDTGPRNYGWHCREGLVSYTGCSPAPLDTVSPIAVYGHTATTSCTSVACSVTGGYIYRGAQFSDLWGYYFYIDYCNGNFRSIISNGSGGWIVNNAVTSTPTCMTSITTFGQDRYGELYVGNQGTGSNAVVYKISGASTCPHAFITFSDTLSGCDSIRLQAVQGVSLTYQWKLEGVDIPGATNPIYYATTTGNYLVAVTNAICTSLSPSVYVNVSTPTPVSYSTLDPSYCHHHIPVTLTGVPAGGVFSGSGMYGNDFYSDSTTLGWHTITYTKTFGPGCARAFLDSTEVIAPTVTFSGLDTIYCVYANAPALNGVPTGGDFSGPGISGTHFYPDSAGVGLHSVIYMYTDGTGCANADTQQVQVALCSSVIKNMHNSYMALYPNPGKGEFRLEFDSAEPTPIKVSVKDELGKEIFNSSFACKKGRNNFPVNLMQSSPGIYFLSISDGHQSHTEKIIIQR